MKFLLYRQMFTWNSCTEFHVNPTARLVGDSMSDHVLGCREGSYGQTWAPRRGPKGNAVFWNEQILDRLLFP